MMDCTPIRINKPMGISNFIIEVTEVFIGWLYVMQMDILPLAGPALEDI